MNYAELKNEQGNEVAYYFLKCRDGNFGEFKTRAAVDAFADVHGGIERLVRHNRNGAAIPLI